MGVEERRSSALKSRRAGAGRSACLHADAGRAISTGGCGLQCGGEGNGVGGASEREREIAAVDFIVLKSSSSQRDARRRAAVPPLPLSLFPPPRLPPPFSPQPRGKVPAGSRGRRQGLPGGGGAGAAAAVPPGSLRDYWGGVGGEKRVGVCARLAAAARLGGGSRVLILLKI